MFRLILNHLLFKLNEKKIMLIYICKKKEKYKICFLMVNLF